MHRSLIPGALALVVAFSTALIGCRDSAPEVPEAVEPTVPTRVFVLGTIHAQHEKNDRYGYDEIVQILQAWDPAAVCVEIRPQEFRQELYLDEMVLATIWALEKGRPVYPIDSWLEETRAEQTRLLQAPEYEAKRQEAEQLDAASEILTAFRQRWGEDGPSGTEGADFWNGDEFAAAVRENYRISVEVFGDSPINLMYLSRNGDMLSAIEAALAKHPGERVAVLTGAEHKHFFDDALARRDDVEAVGFDELGDLPPLDAGPEVRRWLDGRVATLYFDPQAPEPRRASYRESLIDLVHGGGIDVRPWTASEEDIAQAEEVVRTWAAWEPDRPEVLVEQGWLAFLRRKPADALPLLLAAPPTKHDMDAASYHALVGFCHDLLGQRAEALASYQLHLDMVKRVFGPMADGWELESVVQAIEKPYSWPSESTPAGD